MSAIAGIFHLDSQPVDRLDLQRMVDILAHRGQDGAAVWCDGAIGLGHRMLWTTPESLLERLPLVKGDLAITADARIDNRDELIPALGFYGCPAEKITDSELILTAYEKWGERCPERLLGDFVFVIWDGNRQTLFCARDHFGVKPFYYFFSGRTFIFASEIKAIVNLPNVPRQINKVRIADYLTNMMEDKSITAYRDILRLPPAHIMTVDCSNKVQLKPYWLLDPSREIILGSDEEYAEAFRELFTEAVRCRLRSAFPVGSHLSGGLDSSSVTCVARQLLAGGHKQLHTFSNIFDDIPECDEREFIQPIVEQGNLIPHYVRPDRVGALSDWRYAFALDEEPRLIGGNGFLVWGLNRAAQKAGVRITLDGFDGDTTLSHAPYYFTELAREMRWQLFYQEAVALSQQINITPETILRSDGLPQLATFARQGQWLAFSLSVHQIARHFNISRSQVFLQHGLKPLVPAPIKSVWRSLRGGPPASSHSNNARSQIINASFIKEIGIEMRRQEFKPTQPPIPTVRDAHWRALTTGGISQVLEHVNLDAAAYGIESRHPFMDKRLIEFCLALPSTQKLQQGWSRIVMRRAMSGLLPKAVQWRWGKTNMTPNFLHGLLKHNRELLDKVIFSRLESIQEYVDLNRLHTSYSRLTSGGSTLEEDIRIVWTGIGLALWLSHAKSAA